MKHLIAIAAIVIILSSCKKETSLPTNSTLYQGISFFQKVKAQLKDSLSPNDYATVDTDQLYKSKDAQSDGYFVRGAFKNKDLATDFVLLKTDSLGNIIKGKIIHGIKENRESSNNSISFQGRFIIKSLDNTQTVTKEVENGRWKKHSGTMSTMEEAPVGEQDLPEVVVTCYSDDNGYSDGYWYNGFFNDYAGGGGSGYTYGYSGGGGSAGTTTTTSNEDKTMNIEVESNDDSTITVQDYIKCFSTVPDANATYQMTLYADIPVNGDPSELFNTSTGEVGHTFIQLRKTSGSTSIQQNIGFYPQTGWKSLSSYSVDSKVVDNAGHEFNSSLTTTLTNSGFQAALSEVQAIAGKDYNIETWNCTDFALDVFNAANTDKTLTIPKYLIPGTDTYSSTPQGVYVTMEGIKSSGNDSYGSVDIPGIAGYVGGSHGSCGD